MTTEELDKAVKQFGLETISSIAAGLRAVGADNTGQLINSLRFELKETAEGIEMLIKGNDYFKYVENGRKPGKMPPLNEIIKWVSSKGLPRSAAFPIAKKIGKFGIKPRPILKQIIESNKFKESYSLLAEAYAKDVAKEISNIIKENKI